MKDYRQHFLYILLSILLLLSCGTTKHSFLNTSYEKNISSVKEAIKKSLYTTEEQRFGILSKLDMWIKAIEKGKILPSKAEQDTLLALCYRYKADTYQSFKSIKQALEYYDKAIALDTTDINSYFNRAGLYFNNLQMYDIANQEFSVIIEKRPGFADAYHARALTYAFRDMHVEAIVDFNHAIRIDDTKQIYKNDKTASYQKLLQDTLGIPKLKELMERCPEDTEVYTTSACIALAFEDYKQAKRLYGRAIETDPWNATLHAYRGVVHEKLNLPKEALYDYRHAIQLDSLNAMNYFYQGNALLTLKEYQEAINSYTKSIDLCPVQLDAYENRATSYRALENFEMALADYNFIINRHPESAPTYYNRGILFLIMNKYEEAKADFEKVKELDKNDVLNIRDDMDRKLKEMVPVNHP